MQIEVNVTDVIALLIFVLGLVGAGSYGRAEVQDTCLDGLRSPFDEADDQATEQADNSEVPTILVPAPTPMSADPIPTPTPVVDTLPALLTPAPSAAPSTSPQLAAPSPLLSSPTFVEPTMDDDSVFVSRILTNDLIYDLVLASSPAPALYRLARTCRAAHAAVHSHIGRSFKINAHLSEYFTRPLAFRALQARTGTIISGSNALQFLARTTYSDSDLDLYCGYDQREEVGRWLMREEGYRFRPNTRQDPDFGIAVTQARTPAQAATWEFPYSRMKSISAVYSFSKRVLRPDGGPTRWLKVQIIVGYTCAIECILNFHSTAVMNIMTATHAYSLYPRATFQNKLNLSMQPPGTLDAHVVTKYTNRGWRFIHEVPAPPSPQFVDTYGRVVPSVRAGECDHCDHCTQRRAEKRSIAGAFPNTARWIGDRFSWVLPLDTAGLELPAGYQRDPSYFTSWKMIPRPPRGVLVRARKMEYTVVGADGFAYSYVVGNERMKNVIGAVQELYHDSLEGTESGPVSCDTELVRWAQMVLGERGMWNVWFPGS